MKTKCPDNPAVHLARALRRARRDHRRCLKRCRKKFSGKAVHDLRVETRRLLALLDFLEAARIGNSPRKARRLFKKRLDAFDDLRDTQVQLQLLEPLWPEFPEARPLKKWLQRHERKLAARARKTVADIGGRKLSRNLKGLERGIRADAGKRGFSRFRKTAIAVLREYFQRVAGLRRKIRGRDPAAIHRTRVAFKRFRYLNELLQPVLPSISDELLRRMRKFQASAGNIQDLEILRLRLERFIHEGEFSAAQVRGLQSELQQRLDRTLKCFMKHIDELFEFQPGRAALKNPEQAISKP